ncbi:hypothetical protein [Lacrimispora saccharolytica]|uniref:Uncharacterized protein n=1 Tax=Lacrimispora saccharolytica (strain ATCC 35040 / DSM 2544 / NRCC 2533 / WM1) TaxID=610130 RepID=D9R7C4_LACSW|nr:hypothetical protein [Lacrimispora saccharolytica]ADL05556.1 hypothetical protein Closa_3023 [[Clostridium] saccharolyticum WM1]QRV20284.1 hypothetical protein I6K70_01660 [Lacrimispora saccharolytica]
MKTGKLLEDLIDIAQTPKTDFAISMNMTPSGLSKILKGGRLPFLKEKRTFCRQAASYFAEALYGHDCYLKFMHMFPVIYDFSSRYELEMFLACAIENAFDKDSDEENNGNLSHPDREASFLGKKTILNMFCVLLSDCMMENQGSPLEFYSSLPFFDQSYSDIFCRIKILNRQKQNKSVFNHFFDLSSMEASSKDDNINLLSSIVRAEEYVDFNLWKIEKEMNSSFLLLKGRFLMIFSQQLDGMPLMTFVSHKGYLNVFFNSLMRKEAKKISYSGREAAAALDTDPTILSRLKNRHVEAVYNFISIGYLVEEKDIAAAEGSAVAKRVVLELFHSILDRETVFYVTVDAMLGFCSTGKAIVPLFGAVDIPPEERISYLKRFNSFINDKSTDKIRIVNSEQPKSAVFCLQGMNLIYMIDHDYKSEKIHFFETNLFNEFLSRDTSADTRKILDFSPDLWESYLSEMTRHFSGFVK